MSRLTVDRLVRAALGFSAILAGSIVFLIVVFLLREAWPSVEAGRLTDLFVDERWQPGSARDPQYGIIAMLAASLAVTVLATSLAAALGVSGAVFHCFYLPARLARWHQRLLELLAGVPSVVFGFWGLTVLVPAINRIQPPGQSLLAATLVLGLMILPTVALTSHTSLQAVPRSQLQAASALGIRRARLIWNIALPAARQGIGSGILLAAARAIGETMAVVMVCGNIAQMPSGLFDPIRPITSTIALEMGYATASHKALLYAAGLVLVLLTGALVGWLAFRPRNFHTSVH